MLSDVEKFEDQFTSALSQRNLEALLPLFRPPLPVFYPGGVKVDAVDADIRVGLSHLIIGMDRLRIERAISTIMKAERRKGTETIAYKVETRFTTASGEAKRTAIAKRFIEKGDDSYQITMLDVKQPAFGILNGEEKITILY